MKRKYQKPTLAVEYYALTQAIASCGGIKIGGTGSADDVLSDPDSTDTMISYALSGGFISAGGCALPMDGYAEENGIGGDTVCYHGPVIGAFIS